MKILAILTLAFIANANAKPQVLYDIEQDGVITWQGRCSYLSTPYHCILVKLNNEDYLIAGNLSEGTLNVRYILRGGTDPTVVFDYTWRET